MLVLVAAGRTNRQIGQELFITPKTASIHVSRILAKLGVAGRGEAAAVAHRLGLRSSPPPWFWLGEDPAHVPAHAAAPSVRADRVAAIPQQGPDLACSKARPHRGQQRTVMRSTSAMRPAAITGWAQAPTKVLVRPGTEPQRCRAGRPHPTGDESEPAELFNQGSAF